MANKNVIWCDNETLSKDLTGKTYIITGANSGVGLETTRQLVKQGAHVIMACRRVQAGEAEAAAFHNLKGSTEVLHCDLGDLSSIRKFVVEFKSKHAVLDGLACNAGVVVWGSKAQYTKDDFEQTIGVSFFGHFLLTELLMGRLKKSTDARMVILSSVVHANSPKKRHRVNFDDINWKTRKYSALEAYGSAKVAAVLYAKELAERFKETNISFFSVHPGWARSNFGKGGVMMNLMLKVMSPFIKSMTNSNEESAQTSLHCLISDEAVKHPGSYFSQHSALYNDKECRPGGWPMKSPNPNANNMEDAKRLVEVARELVQL